ncbi:MAG TPA: 4Fe-4S dicluster domain-containing protein, partial [Polyangiaceae bacterium]|nr:4Fe-4S dicluster domain-containing protein [Polyangiaceae bacterium]
MIDLDVAQRNLWQDIDPHGNLLYCFSCSTCVVGCPASNAIPPLLIRNLVRSVTLGLEDDLLDNDTPWTCVTCSRCEEMCPMGVDPFEIVLALRRWQCRNDETRIPMAAAEIYKRGYTQPVDKAQEVRASVGLTEPLPTINRLPELHQQFKDMLMQV